MSMDHRTLVAVVESLREQGGRSGVQAFALGWLLAVRLTLTRLSHPEPPSEHMAHLHLTKLTTYNIEDSNIALLGSDVSALY
jgi:hypothetical protein